jgi:hypothetical protein
MYICGWSRCILSIYNISWFKSSAGHQLNLIFLIILAMKTKNISQLIMIPTSLLLGVCISSVIPVSWPYSRLLTSMLRLLYLLRY